MSNVIKFQAPFERLKLFDTSPDVSLRKAIITQAIIDASNVSEDRVAKKRELEAKTWIFGNNEYFKSICIDADIEASLVVKITKQIIKLHRNKVMNKGSRPKNDPTKSDSIHLRDGGMISKID
ncbi:MAG: hypothetical protein ACRYE9_02085 [Janthinobacterium lividum]